MNKGFLSTTLLILAMLLPGSVLAQAQADETGQVYKVQNGDGLYKLSRKFFGNNSGVRKIINAHNEKAANDERFEPIDLKNPLEIGQLLWIPKPPDAAAQVKPKETIKFDPNAPKTKPGEAPQRPTKPPVLVKDSAEQAQEKKDKGNVEALVKREMEKAKQAEQVGQSAADSQATIVDVPKSNCEIRVWYNYQVVAIARVNERWKANGIPLLDRAKRAYIIRHNARVNGRYMMQDRFEVATLRDRDNKKYGNPDGPTFEYLVNYHKESGFEGDEIYERIIESSARTSPVFDSDCK